MDASRESCMILLADDDKAVREFLRKVLQNAGYRVVEAADGREATQELSRRAFDLLIIDLSMPEQEGWETIRMIRDDNTDLKILAISGFFTPEFLTMSKYLGADATLAKPITQDSLLKAVATLLDGNASAAGQPL